MKQTLKKLLIVEDNIYDWRRIKDFFCDHDFDLYPMTEEDFSRFSDKLSAYAANKTAENLKTIENDIVLSEPSALFLDISFLAKRHDRTGVDVYNKLINVHEKLKHVPVVVLTTYGDQIDIDFSSHHVGKFSKNKNGPHSLEAILENRIIPWLSERFYMPLRSQDDDIVPEIDMLYQLSRCPRWILKFWGLKKTSQNKPSKLTPDQKFRWTFEEIFESIQTIVHVGVRAVLYLMVLSLAVIGFIFLIYEVYHMYHQVAIDPLRNFEMINIAEYAFVAFLPMLIVIGFTIFYDKSLGLDITTQDQGEENFEHASRLMQVTKKLFVSTLISYLFIKIIEIASPEAERLVKLTNDDLVRISIFGVIILFLISYYIYLQSHKNPH